MIRLNLSNQPIRVELVPGVIVVSRPLTSGLWQSAGMDDAVRELGTDAAPQELTLAVVKAVARRVILSWEGVGDLDGNPVEPSDDWINALMDQYQIYEAFNGKVISPYILMRAEGNALASSLIGTSGGETTTAMPVKGAAPIAQA